MFPSNRRRVAARGLLLHVVVGLLQIGAPNTPSICYLTCYSQYIDFNSILSRYYKPVHPSPLAFIMLLLEIFLFRIALSFGGGFLRCLDDDSASCRVITGQHTRHIDTIGRFHGIL